MGVPVCPWSPLPVVYTWQDNVFAIKDFCKKKFEGSYDEKGFDRQFGIPADFDYLE